MEQRVLLAIEKATKSHQEYTDTICKGLVLLPDLNNMILEYLMPANPTYWLEKNIFLLSQNIRSLHKTVAKAIESLKASQVLLQQFEQAATASWVSRCDPQMFSIQNYLTLLMDCNRAECHAFSQCICDDPVTFHTVINHCS